MQRMSGRTKELLQSRRTITITRSQYLSTSFLYLYLSVFLYFVIAKGRNMLTGKLACKCANSGKTLVFLFCKCTDKNHQMLQDTENTERMVTQILYGTFKNREDSEARLPIGKKAWETNRAIVIEDCLLTCHGYKYYPDMDEINTCGARYLVRFSPQFPHFEVMILETGETKWLGLGVVFDDYGTTLMPGWRGGTVGYHTDDRNIFDADYDEHNEYKKTTGYAVSRRGDVIRCTVMFENEQERDGKVRVPVVFTVNGSRIILEGNKETYIDFSPDKPLYPYVAFKYENSVLAKMRAREDVNNQNLQLEEVKCELAALKDVTRGLEEKLDALLAKFDDE